MTELERDLQVLETELRKLETEYTLFFAGRLSRPPWESRRRVEAMVRRYDRAFIPNYAQRFRFNTLQSRYTALTQLWERALRAREEGRPGPFAVSPPPEVARKPEPSKPRTLHVAILADAGGERDKIRLLYERLVEARREAGDEVVGFDQFTEFIAAKMEQLRAHGGREVAFRIGLKDGKVEFTAQAFTPKED